MKIKEGGLISPPSLFESTQNYKFNPDERDKCLSQLIFL
jgi:hypothetical protein